MGMFAQYAVNAIDHFDERLYPHVVGEINQLQGSLCEIHSANKARVIISLLKDHCIKTEWLDDNKQLAWMLTTGMLPTSHVESLFNCCKHNKKFLSEFENFITDKFA